MYEQKTPIRFFLGANTPGGFLGYLDDLYDCADGWQAYLIKSGPGTGKATLMRRVLEHMTQRGFDTEIILCSSDPNSLDAVIVPELKVGIYDATAPHIMEPHYWGAVEQIVNLAGCMDHNALHEKVLPIMAATDACTATHARCRKYLSAAASLLGDSARIAAEFTDSAKAVRAAARVASREFGTKSTHVGKEIRRFLSAITPQGELVFYETLQALCPRIYAIEDEYGAVSRVFMQEIRRKALEAGLDIITCACPLFPHDKVEHILIPSIGVGFTASNTWHKADFPVYRRIHSARFTDTERIKSKRQLLSFNRRASKELITEAVAISTEAKKQHDFMEEFNVASMNWEKAGELSDWVISEFDRVADRYQKQ